MEFTVLRDQIAFCFYMERGIYSDVTDLKTLFKYREERRYRIAYFVIGRKLHETCLFNTMDVSSPIDL
jgi:hypothetical protein